MATEKCFACGRLIRSKTTKTAMVVGETTIVSVGHDCFEKIERAGSGGYQPPKGGPKLRPIPTSVWSQTQKDESEYSDDDYLPQPGRIW